MRPVRPSAAIIMHFEDPTDYFECSHVWFPTVQDVLQADWHDVWHSPQPPFLTVF